MRKMGIRRSGLLVHATLIIDTLYKLNKALSGLNWMITGCVANQLWIYLLAGNCIFCRPTDNIDVKGINIIKAVEDYYGVIAEGFEDDLVRRLSFLVSQDPKFKVNVESYSTPQLIDELDRKVIIPFQKQMIPVIGLEDLIIVKLSTNRNIDYVDITGLLKAYKRYLRASIIRDELPPKYLIDFMKIVDLANKLYNEVAAEIIEAIENITQTRISELISYRNNPRKLINLISL